MVSEPSKAERLAALLASVPGVCLGTDLPKRPARWPAPQDSRGCVSGGMVDTQDLGGNRPLQRPLRGLCGV